MTVDDELRRRIHNGYHAMRTPATTPADVPEITITELAPDDRFDALEEELDDQLKSDTSHKKKMLRIPPPVTKACIKRKSIKRKKRVIPKKTGTHRRGKTPNTLPPNEVYLCIYCDKKYKTKPGLLRHMDKMACGKN